VGSRSTVTLVTGEAGSGKSYVRCARFLVDEWLRDHERAGVHYSNFPVRFDGLVRAARRVHGIEEERVRELVRVIPVGELDEWRTGVSGPWDYFKDVDLTGCHIAIDEVHVYCGQKDPKKVRQQWQNWLGEIRHRGCTIELLSQSQHKIASELRWEAGERIELVNSERRRDPWCGIPLGDWYELQAGFVTGEYVASVWETTYRQTGGASRQTWVVVARRKFNIEPEYFGVYDSYSAPAMGGKASRVPVQREFQKRSRLGLGAWFFRRHWLRVSSRAAIAAGILWLMFGGAGTAFGALFWYCGPQGPIMSGMFTQKGAQRSETAAEAFVDEPKEDKAPRVEAVVTSQPVAVEVPAVLRVVAVVGERALFEGGAVVGVGGVVPSGLYAGWRVARVDGRGGYIEFDGGMRLRVGASRATRR
jgi:hypothetical protein